MYFGFFLSLAFGVLLVVMAVNGRLQPTIAAMFGQQQPCATPTGGTGTSGSSGWPFNYPGGQNLNNILQWLQGMGGGGAPNPFGDNPPGQTQGGVPYLP